jgi:reticulon-4-interacting protein 1, mitochondrial
VTLRRLAQAENNPMETKTALFCLGPAAKGALEVRQAPRPEPAADEVEIAIEAASVNPIDVRRAEGYGRRLLSLLGAGRFPMVLGNDFAGTIAATGTRVSSFKPGDRVYGLKPTSGDGTHASHILVKASYVLRVPADGDISALAALPYSFATMWLAVRGAGLTRENAAGKRVLVHGAAGGLGTLALQMLSAWGAKITAIARPPMVGCSEAGGAEILDGSKQPFVSLDRRFDATLNFATWDDDLALVRCLRDGALGHATTVHPLLGNFDRYGWVRGALKSFSEKKSHRVALPKGTRNYAWTLFRPDAAAISDLATLVEQRRLSLPIAIRKPLREATEAFEHVRRGCPGRALLIV